MFMRPPSDDVYKKLYDDMKKNYLMLLEETSKKCRSLCDDQYNCKERNLLIAEGALFHVETNRKKITAHEAHFKTSLANLGRVPKPPYVYTPAI